MSWASFHQVSKGDYPHGSDSASLEFLQKWTEVTAFDDLDELLLHAHINAETATWLRNTCSLERLSRLTVHPSSTATSALSQAVSSLRVLKLVGNFEHEQIFDILTRHGASLQEIANIPSYRESVNARNDRKTLFGTRETLHPYRSYSWRCGRSQNIPIDRPNYGWTYARIAIRAPEVSDEHVLYSPDNGCVRKMRGMIDLIK
ncbi:hypothetical protein CERZMDRAFT_98150 [Cercospora zeae-maydis SCOH1-5]|uniref:Uncharacterized protein n=1 Tax=Cercospora zeae-maydis SCOH1-5 TaxID=717836 RepID=A0A6A6FE58_9PEZI|nr:hypothetical protein CERZMDRAFT_98150 [Cercospora zeae-maydis SCOH1-5]